MNYIHDSNVETIAGMPCKVSVTISPASEAGKASTIMANITLLNMPEVLLICEVELEAMLIPEGSIQDELDRQVALASAEALLDIDGLKAKAKNRIDKLAAIFADQYFGLPS